MARQHTVKQSLCGGQSLHLRLARGTTVAALAGSIRVGGSPVWLAGQMISERVDLGEGCSHVVQDAGWITITARTAAEVIWVTEEREGWFVRLSHGIAAHVRHGQQLLSPGARRS